MHQQQTAFENIVGKGEIARNKQFLIFPQCYLLNQIIVSRIVHIFYIISLFATEFEKPKLGMSVKGLREKCIISLSYYAKIIGFCWTWCVERNYNVCLYMYIMGSAHKRENILLGPRN